MSKWKKAKNNIYDMKTFLENNRVVLFYWIFFSLIIGGSVFLYISDFQYKMYDFLGVYFVDASQYPRQKLMELAPLVFVVIVGVFITLINTLIYLFQMLRKSKFAFFWFLVFLVATVFCAYLMTSFYDEISSLIRQDALKNDTTKLIDDVLEKISGFVRTTEYVSLGIFGCLFIIDLRDYIFQCNLLKKRDSSIPIKEIVLAKNNSLLQLLFIDTPVIIGILCVKYFINQRDVTMLLPSAEQIFVSFSIGAMGMQIIYSQLVFLLSSSYFYYKLHTYKVKMNGKTN